MPWLMDIDYRAVQTQRHKYIHWMQHPELDELYDLEDDPFERRNLIDEPGMTASGENYVQSSGVSCSR